MKSTNCVPFFRHFFFKLFSYAHKMSDKQAARDDISRARNSRKDERHAEDNY